MRKNIKRFGKIVFRIVLVLILLLLILAILLSLPAVQTRLGRYATEQINSDFGTDINIERVAVSAFGGVNLKQVLIRDHHKDTMFFSRNIRTNILSFRELYNGDLLFGAIRLQHTYLNMKIYKGEKDSNLDRFIQAFDDGKPSSGKFLMKASSVVIENGHFLLSDENLENPVNLNLTGLNASIKNFKIKGPDVDMRINSMSFLDHRGLTVKKLAADFAYTKTSITLGNLELRTDKSFFDGNVKMMYDRKDFADFNNKVRFDVKIDSSLIASNDIRYFYSEMGSDRRFRLKSNIRGTLNNFFAEKMVLTDSTNSVIRGDVTFMNLLAKNDQPFSIYGDFDDISSDYKNLTALLPNILGPRLPKQLEKLGRFNMRGKAAVSSTALSADFYMTTALGNIQSDLVMYNIDNIDNAKYKGYVILERFDVGKFFGRNDVGAVTLNLDIDGRGFTEKTLNTTFSGDVYKVTYNDYTYQNVIVNGKFDSPIFQGKVNINDPNLFMDFEGAMTIGRRDIKYDFHTQIDYADLVKLKINKTDTISVFKGDVRMQIEGTSIDDMRGDVYITETSYQNNKDTYLFDDFSVNSSFDENNVRTITINSPDIIEGKLVGRFEFAQLPKMIENSLGSLYANYSPNPVKRGQFLRFDFTIYNKIVEIFYPGIALGPNTTISGNINSDKDDFKLNFNSPAISAFENHFDRISVRLDNKNPLYNAYIEMDSIRTKFYKVSDFSLINVTANDTLFVRSEFKGGTQGKDFFNLNLYHTIGKDKNSIVGFSKSELKIKDYLWYLNEEDKSDNKIIFDKKLQNFRIDNIILSQNGQQMALNGTLEGRDRKDLQLTFKDVDLDGITPAISNFKLKGTLDGEVNFRQENNIYQPTSSLVVDDLVVNDITLGKLNIDITGDDTFRSFDVNSVLVNENVESFIANGNISIVERETMADIDLRFNGLNLGFLSSLGGDVLTNIRGLASGTARIDGNLKEPEINGRLFLSDAGMTIPYLNVNYELDDRSVVDVTENAFIIRNAGLNDTKYKTKGLLNGRIKHNLFGDWALDLEISSDRLLALDTQDSEDAAYYGTAFINGEASITGPTDALFIKVDASSEKGTDVKIPISDAVATGTAGYIHILTPEEKQNIAKGIAKSERIYDGLEMEFNFDITPDAEVEVILDRNTGHGIKGTGYGSLLFKINTLGKFNMWGDFQAYEGIYNFKYGGLIDKKFEVKKGGSIVWEGDPMRAILNIEAVYKTTANPGILLENASFNKKVPVEVVIGIRGNLLNPEPEFTINFPTVSSVLESEIQYKLADSDTRQTQALYLLSSGAFLSPEGVNQQDLAGNFFERASGLFNDIFQDEDGKFVVGVDYVSPDKRPGIETDGRFGFSVSTKINERITINGKVGVPVGGINESTIVGDVEVLYRVNEDGTLNVRVFNRENDINYIGQGIGYTQGVGLNYEVDFDTFKEFVNKLFKNIQIDKEVLKRTEGEELVPDSSLPDYIEMERPKKKETPERVNGEAVPHEE